MLGAGRVERTLAFARRIAKYDLFTHQVTTHVSYFTKPVLGVWGSCSHLLAKLVHDIGFEPIISHL